MKVATWNVNSLRVRMPQLREWLESRKPDLAALQETKVTDPEFPLVDVESAGYHVVYAGQKTYNGVAILARKAAHDVATEIPAYPCADRRVLAATYGPLRLINLYVPNGSEVGSDKYQFKLAWLEALTAWLRNELTKHRHVVVLGDFNIAPDERDVYDVEVWKDSVLFSPPERAAFQRIFDLGLVDCFRLHTQDAGHYSWWDYRMGAFRRNMGLRIDHILASPELSKLCVACEIDKEPRKQERPSDHAPVIAEFTLTL
jgi:exodeoxyribonuclease-3